MRNLTQRPAFGEIAALGSFYNARSDSFLPQSLFSKDLPPESVLRTNQSSKTVRASYADSYEEKFKTMGVGAELGASILAGLVVPGGSGRYLDEKRGSKQILHGAIHHQTTTFQEKLIFGSSGIEECLAFSELRNSEVTHIVIDVKWGAQCIVSVNGRSSSEGQFKARIESFKSAVENGLPLSHENATRSEGIETSLEITAFSDILTDEGIIQQDFQEAYDFLNLMPVHIKNTNSGKGNPIVYTLLPIDMLAVFLTIEIIEDVTSVPPSAECLSNFVKLLDEFCTFRQGLSDYEAYVKHHKLYMPRDHAQHVANCLQRMKTTEMNLRSKYASVLQAVRKGTSDPNMLWTLLRDFATGDSSPKKIAAVDDSQRDKVAFIQEMVSKGAMYIGYNGRDLHSELAHCAAPDSYVFYFSAMARQDQQSWEANKTLLLELLNEPRGKGFIAIVDCDATSASLEKAHISHFQEGKEVSTNLLEDRQFLADKSFARCDRKTMETRDIQQPLKRRFVKIPCPGNNCMMNEVCEWLCPKCLAPLEFGYSDQYFYCICGRSLYKNFDFKCKSSLHGPGYERYDQAALLSLLQKLDQSNYQNILILGETGVGKSTFINAFLNYLTFETLEEAKQSPDLHWVIPCSFSTQVMDRTGPDGEIVETEIMVGSRPDEHDGSKGASATQQTTVYPVTIGTSTIRLIDTPGIGDTRGIGFDRKNMADILQTLGSYDELHGILILLKSNAARLTIGFIYCLKELLKHLHRSAARNIAFGFTGARVSNYSPGDTYGPLKNLLNQHPDIGLSLNAHTTYCFDSESFRYLAAFKKGVFMDNEEDFRRSWKHSRDEALRLVKCFNSKPPHEVNSTISLNGARELIAELTKPMAEISALIRKNIALHAEREKELSTTKLSGDKLRQRLTFKVIQFEPENLAKPRTVCTAPTCVDYKDDGNGNGKLITIFKTHCHPVCYLTDVRPDTAAHPGLRSCAAFNGTEYCKGYRCGHSWQQHQHVMYELREKNATLPNTETEKQIKAHADDVTLKQTAIRELETLRKEYEWEHKQIQQAAAQFGLFLKKNSLSPVNDKTIEYIDFLIAAEKDKIEAGGSKQQLQALEKDRREYLETIKILTDNMKGNANIKPLDEEGVSRLVNDLYRLKHFGANLQRVKNVIASAHQATYRERPYRVQSKAHSHSKSIFHGVFSSQPSGWHHGGIPHRHPHPHAPSMAMSTMRPQPSTSGNSKRRSGMGWFAGRS